MGVRPQRKLGEQRTTTCGGSSVKAQAQAQHMQMQHHQMQMAGPNVMQQQYVHGEGVGIQNPAPYNPMMATAPQMQGGYMPQPTHQHTQGVQRSAAGVRHENEGLVTTDVTEMSKRRRDK